MNLKQLGKYSEPRKIVSVFVQVKFPDFTPVILYGNSISFPCKSGIVFQACRHHILPFQGRGKLTPRAAGHDDAKKWSVSHSSDDQLFVLPGNNEHQEEPREERSATLMHSDIHLQPNTGNHGNLESILDKMKAIHLHVLAMERWNSARLKMCHRCALTFSCNMNVNN